MQPTKAIKLLRNMFAAAIAAADPMSRVPEFLPSNNDEPLVVVGAGKASARMAQAVEAHWRGPLSGIVVTRYGHAADCENIEILQAAHPVPDLAGVTATERILQLVSNLHATDQCLVLISGGGSALLTAPAPLITLAEKQWLNQELLASGAAIHEINCVRKHLSRVKGGRLAAAAAPAKVISLLISDVPGDDPATIASGPTVGDPTSLEDARAVLERYEIKPADSIRRALCDEHNESPAPDDPKFASVETHVIAAPQQSLQAAARVASDQGVTPMILGDAIEGEAREMGRVMAGIAQQVRRNNLPASAPCVLISGGESTVTIQGDGSGGRNVEFLLSLTQELRAAANIYALAADTDGIDGIEEIAGAVSGPDTLSRAHQLGLSAAAYLKNNDAHTFFEALGDQVITGPTLTNVNDFRAILII